MHLSAPSGPTSRATLRPSSMASMARTGTVSLARASRPTPLTRRRHPCSSICRPWQSCCTRWGEACRSPSSHLSLRSYLAAGVSEA
eukprot:s119_g20.t1